MTVGPTNQVVNGNKEGLWITRFANGILRSKGEFKQGKKHGFWQLFHKNGQLQSEATFAEGLYTGHYVSYHENGKRFREGHYRPIQGNSGDGRKEGVWFQYLDDGETVEWEITYKRGKAIQRIDRLSDS